MSDVFVVWAESHKQPEMQLLPSDILHAITWSGYVLRQNKLLPKSSLLRHNSGYRMGFSGLPFSQSP
jgi:hypothetical protein